MPQQLFAIDRILELLADAPASIEEMIRGHAAGDLERRIDSGEWSVNEILAHLRASATVRGEPRIGCMLAKDEPTFRTSSPRSDPGMPTYLATTFRESFAAYVAQREALLVRLRPLHAGDWQRGATLTSHHKTRRETVQSEASALAQYELQHLQ